MLENFLQAINEKKIVSVAFVAKEDGILRVRKCVPFDYGVSRKYKDGENRFHFYDLNSPEGKHNLSLLPAQIQKLDILNEVFNPIYYVTWTPINWIVKRDWGLYS
ncbi:hypothetical protein [Sulfurimonas sp.]|uniref:hypothetical protein n=1 Tax=Sulfurimonas sp. TaxID=2022749 RepID=UPI0019F090E3|nr:hypothetical protein [Sulfurimonas sp.]MBE0515583.1 hypothetical protein [Sulfurimonas sp.]